MMRKLMDKLYVLRYLFVIVCLVEFGDV